MGTVSYIPLTMPFLATLAKGLIDQAGDNRAALQSFHILLPTRRAVRVLTELFLDLTDGAPLLLPRLQAVADVDDEELDLLVAGVRGEPLDIPPAVTVLERQLILTDLIRARADQQDYAQAAGLAQALGALMDSVQNEGLDLNALSSLVRDDFAQHWQMTLTFLEIIKDAWPALLAERGKIDPAARRNLLLQALADHWRTNPPSYPVIVAGVSGSLPAVADLMDVVRILPQGQVILSGFDPDQDEGVWATPGDQHPLADLVALLQRFDLPPSSVKPWDLACHVVESPAQRALRWLWRTALLPAERCEDWANLRTTLDDSLRSDVERALTDSLQVIEVDHRRDEALAIALRARASLDDPECDIAVITPDRQLAQDIVMACARFGVDVSDSAGEKLVASAAGMFARLALRVVDNGFHPVDVLALLRHPLCQFSGFRADRVDLLDRKALRGLRPAQTADEFCRDVLSRLGERAQLVAPLLEGMMKALSPLIDLTRAEDIPSGLDLVQAHVQALDLLSKPAAAQSEEDEVISPLWQGEDGQALARLLAQMIDHHQDLPNLSLRDYAALFSQMVSGVLYNRPDRSHPRVRVLGVYEARLTRADHVILAGFNEGIWPSEAKADPWMSRTMRRDFGLPAVERAVGRMALDVMQLVTAPRVTITRARRMDGDVTTPSRWLRRLDTVLQALDLSPEMIRNQKIPEWVRRLDRPEGAVTPCARPGPMPLAMYRPQEIYATQVETLMRDPYEFYAERVLRLRPLDEHDEDPDQRLRGQIVHRVLQLFAESVPDRLPSDARQIMQNYLTEVLQEQLPDPVQRAMLRPRLERALVQYLEEWEADWRETGARPFLLESTWERNFDLPSGGSVLVRARMDRIDRTAHGDAVIIDYKTSNNVTRKDVACGVSPQLPVEVLLVEGGRCVGKDHASLPVSAIGLWAVKVGEAKKYMWQTDDPKNDLAPLRANAQDGVVRLLDTFARSTTPYISQPDPGYALAYPRYTHLARVEEWGGQSGDDQAGGEE